MTRAEQDELIVEHLPQVELIAKKIYWRIGMRIPLDDLKQYGALGLVVAAAHFNPALGWKFKTYAEYRVRGFIFDGIRGETRSRLRAKGQEFPTQLVSLDLAIHNRADEGAGRDFSAAEAGLDLARISKNLTPLEGVVIEAVLREKAQTVIAEEMGFTVGYISQIFVGAKNHMRRC